MLQLVERFVPVFRLFIKKKGDKKLNKTDDIKNIAGHHTEASTVPVLKSVDESVQRSSKELTLCSIQVLICLSSDGAEILFCIRLTPYVADIPECKNMLLAKRRMQTATLCHHLYLVAKLFSARTKYKNEVTWVRLSTYSADAKKPH